jgi:hypothetical protein
MSLKEKTKHTVIVKKLIENNPNEKLLEEVGLCARRKKLWEIALQKSRGEEQRANALFFEYRDQAVSDEVKIAKALLEESPATIIHGYMSKVEQRGPEWKKRQHNMPRDTMSQKYQRKKCYKCRKVVFLTVQTCPNCNCNSFVFCG